MTRFAPASEAASEWPAQAAQAVEPGYEPIVVWIDDPDLAEMIPSFLENRIRDLAALRGAGAAQDCAAVRRLGHDMKGTGAGYGFDGITRIGAELERAAIRGDLDAIRCAVEELADFLARVEVRVGAPPDLERPGVHP